MICVRTMAGLIPRTGLACSVASLMAAASSDAAWARDGADHASIVAMAADIARANDALRARPMFKLPFVLS